MIYVKVTEHVERDADGRSNAGGTRVELRVRPTVQGVAVVLENRTGRVLAMAGGFSYPLSQLNRVTQSRRQPGSSFKPMTYLAALNSGLQPNTLVDDAPITYPPIGGVNALHRATPTTGRRTTTTAATSGTMTMRRALEQSKNLVTARLLDGGIADEPSREPRRRSASSRSRRTSIRNASGIIRSCSAPSRCGRSISPASMPRSPTRASARRRM